MRCVRRAASSPSAAAWPRGSGQPARWTLSGASASWLRTRWSCSISARNGVNGAMQPRQRRQHLVERLVRRFLGGGRRQRAPEARAAAADVPVGEVVDEAFDQAGRPGDLEAVELPCVTCSTSSSSRSRIQRSSSARSLSGTAAAPRVPAVEVGVDGEERERVPQRQQEALRRLAHQRRREARGLLGVVDVEVPAQGVGAGLLDHPHRLDDVAAAAWSSCGPARR